MASSGLIATVHHCLRTLSAALNDAIAAGALAQNPVPQARTPRYEPDEPGPYAVTDMRRILAVAAELPNGALSLTSS
jgi:hypothetical protein